MAEWQLGNQVLMAWNCCSGFDLSDMQDMHASEEVYSNGAL
jgi:hypothetical protein